MMMMGDARHGMLHALLINCPPLFSAARPPRACNVGIFMAVGCDGSAWWRRRVVRIEIVRVGKPTQYAGRPKLAWRKKKSNKT
jgi:hypothetical protein